MKSVKLFSICALLASAVSAHAQSAYQIDVARVEGSLTCDITKGDDSSVNCSINVAKKAHLSIDMNAIENQKGYVGIDKLSEGAGKFVLAVVADETKQLKDLVMMQGQSANDQVFDGSLSVTASNSLTVVNIDPIHVEKNGSTTKLSLQFVVYAPATSATAQDQHMLTQTLLQKIQPALTAVTP